MRARLLVRLSPHSTPLTFCASFALPVAALSRHDDHGRCVGGKIDDVDEYLRSMKRMHEYADLFISEGDFL